MTLDEIQHINKSSCPAFATFARHKLPMPGTKVRLDKILNREILVTDFRVTKSKHHPGQDCLQIQFFVDNDVFIAFTGSSVLMDQITSVGENIPFRATVVKIDRYYSFS